MSASALSTLGTGFLRRNYTDRVWIHGDSTAGGTGTFFGTMLKRICAVYGHEIDLVGTQNPAPTGIDNQVARDNERDSTGGATPDQLAAEIPAKLAQIRAEQGEPSIVILQGNYNTPGDVAIARAMFSEYFRVLRANDYYGPLIVMGKTLQNGAMDSNQEAHMMGLHLAIADEALKDGPLRRTVMAPTYTLGSWPPDDRQTTDNTHPNDHGAYIFALSASTVLLGVPAMDIERAVGGPVGLINGPGGNLALWCARAIGGNSTVQIAVYDRFGRMGGRGVANANSLGTFSIVINTTGGTIKNLLGGNWEASMVRGKLLDVAPNPIMIWPGASINGNAVEVTDLTVQPEIVNAGNYRTITQTGRPPEIWLG